MKKFLSLLFIMLAFVVTVDAKASKKDFSTVIQDFILSKLLFQ